MNKREHSDVRHKGEVVLDVENKSEKHHFPYHRHLKETVIEDDDSSDYELPHHMRHLLEEAIGLWALAREILGDRRHHKRHLIEGMIGANGLIRELDHRS